MSTSIVDAHDLNNVLPMYLNFCVTYVLDSYSSPLLALRVPCASQAVWNTTKTRYAQTLAVFDPNCFAMLGVAKGIKKGMVSAVVSSSKIPVCADE
jgi:hypothetical protein